MGGKWLGGMELGPSAEKVAKKTQGEGKTEKRANEDGSRRWGVPIT
jgi:hypothetical protein